MNQNDDKLPLGWSKIYDPTYQCYYYYNEQDHVSQWEYPSQQQQQQQYKQSNENENDLSTVRTLRAKPKKIQATLSRQNSNYSDQDIHVGHGMDTEVNDKAPSPYYSDIDMESPNRRASQFVPRNYVKSNTNEQDESTFYDRLFPGNDHKINGNLFSDDDNDWNNNINRPYRKPSYSDVDSSGNEKEVIPTAIHSKQPKQKQQRQRQQHDYVQYSKLYQLHRIYQDPHCTELCILCKTNQVDYAFFPCDHRCVCYQCIVQYDICEYTSSMMDSYPNSHFNCPLCASMIKKILPMENGDEIEKYWNWCYEVIDPLPKDFEKRFQITAEALQKIYIDEANSNDYDVRSSSSCIIT